MAWQDMACCAPPRQEKVALCCELLWRGSGRVVVGLGCFYAEPKLRHSTPGASSLKAELCDRAGHGSMWLAAGWTKAHPEHSSMLHGVIRCMACACLLNQCSLSCIQHEHCEQAFQAHLKAGGVVKQTEEKVENWL